MVNRCRQMFLMLGLFCGPKAAKKHNNTSAEVDPVVNPSGWSKLISVNIFLLQSASWIRIDCPVLSPCGSIIMPRYLLYLWALMQQIIHQIWHWPSYQQCKYKITLQYRRTHSRLTRLSFCRRLIDIFGAAVKCGGWKWVLFDNQSILWPLASGRASGVITMPQGKKDIRN